MLRGLIFDIKRFAVHDGPGIRTTVFFKGCPLSCPWCHNPEGRSFSEELCFFESRCIGCGICVKSCPFGAIFMKEGDSVPTTNREICKACGVCVEACPTGARKVAGKWYTVDELLCEIKKDIPFYDTSGGGVTASGGEPLTQAKFLSEFLKACKEIGVRTALDTSGYADWETISSLIDYVDLFLYDVKLIDGEKHKRWIGVPNEPILSNLKKLVQRGGRIFIRYPLIPGVNDSLEDIDSLGRFLSEIGGIEEVDILPYHKLGVDKAKRLGKKDPVFPSPDKEGLDRVKAILEGFCLKVKIGGVSSECL
ncbi:MAG: glycyl-radical enzyme activating protein [Synergistetes bacterium]|nr:glycyl-radical enzyme activating protein [Synergistota bacterium]